MEYINAKTILQKVNYGHQWFGIEYNMNLYKGCNHGCIYCDSRRECYGIENFNQIRIKKDAISILEKELKSKRKKGVIGMGSMADSYNMLEENYEITKKALEKIRTYGFGVSLETKSDRIIRDISLFQKVMENQPVILKMTITAADDELCRKLEPNVCVTSKRWKAINQLAKAGLFVGVLLMPVIPFVTDTEENITQIIKKAKENGAKFVYSMGGLTLCENQKEYFYEQIEKHFPGMRKKYESTFGKSYCCYSQNKKLNQVFKQECKKRGLLYTMQDIIAASKPKQTKIEQLSFIEREEE